MRPSSDTTGVRVETAAILPGGAVHRHGGLLHTGGSFTDAVRTAWQAGQRTSADLGTPVVMKVAYPNGQVEARTLRGWERPVPHEASDHLQVNDPRWDDPVPDRLRLLGAVRAAQRAGQFAAAEVAAGALAGALRTDLGTHPHTGLALELQAQCAADARRWNRAAVLYSEAAALRHRLGSPGDAEAACARRAVSSWLQTSTNPARIEPDALSVGFALAHALIALCPGPRELGAVLRRLAEHLPAYQRHTTQHNDLQETKR